jgi:hypothetical protein
MGQPKNKVEKHGIFLVHQETSSTVHNSPPNYHSLTIKKTTFSDRFFQNTHQKPQQSGGNPRPQTACNFFWKIPGKTFQPADRD